MIVNKYYELIGKTPMLRAHNYARRLKLKAEIILKLENFNPLASVKDRLAYALVKVMEEQGKIKKDTILIEPTSGNTGIGLAFICAAKGYKLILVMPETVNKERILITKALGAKIILTSKEFGIQGAVDKATSYVKKYPKKYVMPLQFENLANPEIHRRTTAQEILKDTRKKIDFLVAGVGTGGTITGVGEVLKKKIRKLKVIAVEPKNSPVLSKGIKGSHKIYGIGPGFVPKVLNTKIYDEIFPVLEKDAYKTARLLAKTEGVLAGTSAGAALYAATKVAQRAENAGKRIVVIIPDTGERYLSTPLYDPDYDKNH
jgi:cysteine synthase A